MIQTVHFIVILYKRFKITGKNSKNLKVVTLFYRKNIYEQTNLHLLKHNIPLSPEGATGGCRSYPNDMYQFSKTQTSPSGLSQSLVCFYQHFVLADGTDSQPRKNDRNQWQTYSP